MTRENDRTESPLNESRRRYIKAIGAAGGIGALAGCLGGGDDDDGVGGDPVTGEPAPDEFPQVDTALVSRFDTPPNDVQFNYYNPNNQATYSEFLLYSPIAWYSTQEGEYFPFLAEDWEWLEEGEHFRLHIGDFWTWHNGDQLTAEDVATQIKLETYLGGASSEIESVEVVDDWTVDVFTHGTLSNELLEFRLFTMDQPRSVSTSVSEYGDMLEEIESTEEGTDARDEALGAVVQYAEMPPIGTGPFQHADTQEGRIVLEPFEDYPMEQLQQQIEESDHVDYEFPDWALTEPNYPAVYLNHFADGSALRQAWFASNVDIGSDAPPEDETIIEQYPNTHTMTLEPTYRGSAMAFDLEHPVWGQVEFRRAMAHAIDVTSIAETTYGATGFANTSFSGLPRALVQLHLDNDFVENTLESFVDQDFEAAEAEMQRLVDRHDDFGRDGGTWTHQGDDIVVPLAAPSTVSTHMNAMRQLQSWLGQVGFEAEIEGTEGAIFWSETMPSGDWEVAQNYFGGAQPHPYFAYRNTWISGFLIEDTHNPPETVEVPPIGEDSGSETVNVAELTEELATPISDDRQREIIEQLAWAWNQFMPYVPYAERHDAWMLTMERFHFPHPDDKAVSLQRNPFILPALGLAVGRENPIDQYPYDVRYHSIDGTPVDGGMSLEDSKTQVPFGDQSW